MEIILNHVDAMENVTGLIKPCANAKIAYKDYMSYNGWL